MPAKLVVLISGNGSNLQAILDACANQTLPAEVAAVISNVPDAYGLTRAGLASVPAIVFQKNADESRRDYDFRLANKVEELGAEYVVLAGWMRLLSSAFLERFPDRVINLHPALPGTFPGTHAIERAYAALVNGQVDRSGVMVHLVPDEGVDSGPVLDSREIYLQQDETLEHFAVRVHELEHELLVATLSKVISVSRHSSLI